MVSASQYEDEASCWKDAANLDAEFLRVDGSQATFYSVHCSSEENSLQTCIVNQVALTSASKQARPQGPGWNEKLIFLVISSDTD